MVTKFEMSDLGKLTYYLGIEVCQDHRGITLKQDRYARKIMEDCRMAACNSVSTPMDVNVKLSRLVAEKSINERDYRRSIGCLRYLLHTRPDLSFSVGVLSRYMHDPKQSHGAALKQQEIVALSSCEAEFMAATEAAKQAIWLQDLLGEVIGQASSKVVVKVDNKYAIALSKNPVFHGWSKYIRRRFHFIRECVGNDQVEVEHVAGSEQRADVLTKSLGRIKFGDEEADWCSNGGRR
ncbi:uncharacterized protein LOC125590430 [Brassica napus]|uniref:uncharacterized protein LOC125590430 n=1 Tax=Brassica napus TaxID=3708 RepID=UPI00207A3459|nr:uncharacterized protein LOC125590430 [Brassica napus]